MTSPALTHFSCIDNSDKGTVPTLFGHISTKGQDARSHARINAFIKNVQKRVAQESAKGSLDRNSCFNALRAARDDTEGDVPHCTTLQGDLTDCDFSKASIFGHTASRGHPFGSYKEMKESDFGLDVKSDTGLEIPCDAMTEGGGFTSAFWPIMTFDEKK